MANALLVVAALALVASLFLSVASLLPYWGTSVRKLHYAAGEGWAVTAIFTACGGVATTSWAGSLSGAAISFVSFVALSVHFAYVSRMWNTNSVDK